MEIGPLHPSVQRKCTPGKPLFLYKPVGVVHFQGPSLIKPASIFLLAASFNPRNHPRPRNSNRSHCPATARGAALRLTRAVTAPTRPHVAVAPTAARPAGRRGGRGPRSGRDPRPKDAGGARAKLGFMASSGVFMAPARSDVCFD